MKVIQDAKFLAISSMTVVALSCLSLAAAETSKFFVECHSFAISGDNKLKDYAYHLRAFGYSEEVTNGINVNLDDKNIVLSVESRESKNKEYSPLYPKLTLVMRQKQPCQNGKCKQVEYEPQDFKGKLVVTYDQDKGVILIEHAIMPEIVVQSRGGCQFVAIPSQN